MYILFFFEKDSLLNGQRVWISIKTKKREIFPSASGELEIIIIPSFNKYFYPSHKNHYKKSISPILEKIKKISTGKVLTLDGSIIGDELMLNHVI